MTIIVDLDGTLTQKDTYLPFLALCIKELGIKKFSLVSLPFYSLLYFMKIISNQYLKEQFLKKILAGTSCEQVELIADKFVSQLVESGLNDTMLSRLNEHIQKGDTIIMATASFDFYVLKIAKKLKIMHAICTRAEVHNGIITGRIFGRNCHGIEKIKRLQSISGPDSLENATVYSDHHSDFPILSKGCKSYLVKPNFITRLKLKKYNFSIIN